MHRPAVLLASVALICALLSQIEPAFSQTKVERQIDRVFKSAERVRVIIVNRPDPDQVAGGAAVASAASYLSGRLGATARNVKAIGKLPAVSAEITKEALERLRDDPNVALVVRDIPVPPALFKSVPFIGANLYHKSGVRGTGFNVAVLDTGVDKSHPGLSKSVVKEACFSTSKSSTHNVKSLCPQRLDASLLPGAAGQCPRDVPGCDHGTHVAGIVAGHDMVAEDQKFTGVAPAAGVVAVQVFTLFENDPENCGSEGTCILSFSSDQLRALEWLYRNRTELKIAAVNMSLGSGYYEANCDLSSALTEIIERLRSKQIPTVVAAGNEAFFDGIGEPACISHAISVAAVDGNGELDVSYSNVSPFVSIAAPGTNILSTVFDGRYEKLMGTSMAAPHVAASFALMRQKNPQATVKQMIESIFRVGVPTTDPRTGTVVQRIDLSKLAAGSPEAPVVASVGGGAADSPALATRGLSKSKGGAATTQPEPRPTVVSDSYIVRSNKPAAEIRSILSEKCPNHDCELKQIGNDSYKLEIKPKSSGTRALRDVGGAGTGGGIDKSELERMLGGGAKVYDNRLSRPSK